MSSQAQTAFLLYGDDGYDSHVLRLLMEEKQLPYRFLYVDCQDYPDDLTSLNPYRTLPILVNKDIALYEINVIFEYLEERHPAIKLLPPTPKERAQSRLLAWRIQHDWLSLAKVLLTHPDSLDPIAATNAKKKLSDLLITLSPLFGRQPFFLSENLSFCDILLSPLLWRLTDMGIHLPEHLCRPLIAYQTRLFARPTFKQTLSNTQDFYYDDEP